MAGRVAVSLAVFWHLTGVLTGAAIAEEAPDPHAIYEQRCAQCHDPHAGDFASKNFTLRDGRVVISGTTRTLAEFLEGGHGGLERRDIDTLASLFERILSSGQLYRQKCRGCHDRAVTFVRLNLILKDGRLVSRYSDRDIAEFLVGHGRLEADEVAKMVDVLRRQIR